MPKLELIPLAKICKTVRVPERVARRRLRNAAKDRKNHIPKKPGHRWEFKKSDVPAIRDYISD